VSVESSPPDTHNASRLTRPCHPEALSVIAIDSPLDRLPPPPAIHERMGCLYRELALLRRLLRLSQAAREERCHEREERREVSHVR
jgi:hypothetical protein